MYFFARFATATLTILLLHGSGAICHAEEAPAAQVDWGPLVGPWQRYEHNPIITLEGTERASVQTGPQSVVRFRDRWWMFLQAFDGRQVTKLAVSDDGLHWKRETLKPILTPEHPWEGSYCLTKAARVQGDEIWLYYFGKQGRRERIGLATSSDLKTWTKHEDNPIFTSDQSHIDGTRAFPSCVVKHEEKYYLYYDVEFDYGHPTISNSSYSTGAAVSSDGVHFEDSPKTPMLSPGPPDAWDGGSVSHVSVVPIGDSFYMLYAGRKIPRNPKSGLDVKRDMAFGLARAPHPEGPWEKYPGNPIFTPDEGWDGVYLQHPCIVPFGDTWRLYYTGWGYHKSSRNNSVGGHYAIGLALRADDPSYRTTRSTSASKEEGENQ